jgi:hypothetical protein
VKLYDLRFQGVIKICRVAVKKIAAFGVIRERYKTLTKLISYLRCYHMNQYRQYRNCRPPLRRTNEVVKFLKLITFFKTLRRFGLAVTWAVMALAAVSVSTGEWGAQPAWADNRETHLPLTLTVTGPATSAIAGTPLEGINVRLLNAGLALRDSRLRLFIHDDKARSVNVDDIKIDVQEAGEWKPVLVETIDGGVMGAIGAEGDAHKEPHKSGGFAIGERANKVWLLRITFRLSGHYSMVMSVSPDNGETQLAQPISFKMEAL